jgi:thymidylate synthase (FAD)
MNLIQDSQFKVTPLAKTDRPNLVSYLAMHQCYAEDNIIDEVDKISKLSDSKLGDRIVNKCLKFGHWSVIEHPHITFCVSGFPHSVMVQATRHRLLSFSVQSQRYTGERIAKVSKNFSVDELEKLFYFRPVGKYFDREGNKYEYNKIHRYEDMRITKQLMDFYKDKLTLDGLAPEQARDLLPQNIRQDFVVTFNARSLLHFCDLRLPSDAQPEIRSMAEMLFSEFKLWMPEVANHYEKTRKNKNKLAP